MKKFIFLAAIAATVVASCAKDPLSIEEKVKKEGMIPYKAAVKFDATKSTIDDKKIVWEVGEKVAIFDDYNTEPNEFTVTGVNESGAWIEGEISELAEKIYGVYPYSAAVGITLAAEAGDSLTVTLPSVQTIEAGKVIASDALVTVSDEATPDDDVLNFYNPFSVLKFTVPVDGVKKVVFSGLDGKGVTGNQTVRVDNSGERSIKVKGTSSLTVSKADGFEKGTEYYATVFSRYVEGVRFVFTADDYKANVESAKTAEFVKNRGLTFKFTETQIETDKFPINIYGKEDLDTFAAHSALYDAGEWVNLCADIDYEGGDWTTTGDFAGNFDGKGCSIYNINIKANSDNNKAGLIGTVKGSAQFKDLKLGYNPETMDYDGTSTLTTVDGLAGSNFNVGVLAATVKAKNAKIENITNYIPVTVTTTLSTEQQIEFRVGGVLGAITGGSDVSVKSCKNYAGININHSYRIKSDAYFAGITGLVSSDDCVFDGCENHGAVTIPSKAIYGSIFMGGIIGRLGVNNQGLMINECINNGDLYDGKNNGENHQPYLAGIIAADDDVVPLGNTKMTVLKCVNNGQIQCISQSGGLHIGGICALMKANSLIDQCTNNGDIYKNGNCGNENVYVGGILGRGAAPTEGNALVSNCVNEGVVKGIGQTSKITVCFGGIVGTSFIEIKDCTNSGEIKTEGTGDGSLCLGGIVGIHSNGAPITGCKNFGNVTLSNDFATSACGGLVGQQNNVETSTFEGCVVNCAVNTYVPASSKGGMILGGYTESCTPVFNCGTDANPVQVGGSLDGVTVKSGNINDLLSGGTNPNATYKVVLYSE